MRRDPRFWCLIPALALAGCNGVIGAMTHTVVGTGPQKTETRNVDAFTKVQISNAIEADIKIGEKPSVVVDAKESLLPLVTTSVQDGKLLVSAKESIDSTTPIKVHIVTSNLTFVGGSGASTVDVSQPLKVANFEAEATGASTLTFGGDLGKFKLNAEGASTVKVSGNASELSLTASGASRIDGDGFDPEDTTVEASGASTVDLGKMKKLNAQASGASTVNYKGNPEVTRSEATGASSVQPKG